MTRNLPALGEQNWGNILNDWLQQIGESTNGGINTFNGEPTGLTADDTGYTFVDTASSELKKWDGTAFVVLVSGVGGTGGEGADYFNTTTGTLDDITGGITNLHLTTTLKSQYDAKLDSSSVIDEDDMISDSDTNIPTQQSVKAYVDNLVNGVSGGLTFKDGFDASTGSFPSGADKGYYYKVTADGTVDSMDFVVGDTLFAVTDSASTTTYANNWFKVDNTDGVNSVNGQVGAVVLDNSDLNLNLLDLTDTPSAYTSATDILRVNATNNGVEMHTLTKADVGLSNVDNTSDADKPVSTAIQTALDGKLDNSQMIDEDDMISDSDTNIPTQQSVKSYVDTAIAAVDLTDLVPYTGATGAVDLGSQTLSTTGTVSTGSLDINGAFTVPFTATTASITLDNTHYIVSASGASSTVAVTLPTAVGIVGRKYVVKCVDLTNPVSIETAGAETIDGESNYDLDTLWENVELVSDGTNWLVISAIGYGI